MTVRKTPKTTHFLSTISGSPGITTAELHRRVGEDYAHGHHKYTYETVAKMHLNGLVRYGVGLSGARGAGLYVTEEGQRLLQIAGMIGTV